MMVLRLSAEAEQLLDRFNDVVAMITAICSLLDSQEKTKVLALNARNFIEKMDWNVVKEDWKQVLS